MRGPDFSARALAGPRRPSPIKHIIFLMQENRSFDNLWQGYPGADTRSWGLDSKNAIIKLQPIPLEAPYDINHSLSDFLNDVDGGKMNGFDLNQVYGQSHPKSPTYGYVPQSETTLYWNMANQYVLADHMFTSHIDMSFVSHQYFIAGQAQNSVNIPSGVWGCPGGPADMISTLNQNRTVGSQQVACFDYTTLGDELDAAHKSWRYYAASKEDMWSAYQAIDHIYNGKDWNNVLSPSAQFITDVQAGKLANFTWIAPDCTHSDHPGCYSNKGPSWVASVVDAVGQSKFWKTSQIFVMWDEWGGWYDHVPPPYVDYDGLGIRVGLLMIGPYDKEGYVTHVQYEHGSVLRFAEDQFGLPRLAASDARANSPEGDAIDFTQKPRRFQSFNVKEKTSDFFGFPDRRARDEN